MKALLIHASEFSYRVVKKAIPEAEDIVKGSECLSLRNALVLFVSVEKGDCDSIEEVVDMASRDVVNTYRLVKASHIVIYPYAHLSKDLAKPDCALKTLKLLESRLSTIIGPNHVSRAPFGWYKSFTISCYGHPLSELSRSYSPMSTPQTLVCVTGEDIKNRLGRLDKDLRLLRSYREFSIRFGLRSEALASYSAVIADSALRVSLTALSKGLNLSDYVRVDLLEAVEAPSIESLFIEIPLRITMAEYVERALREGNVCLVGNVNVKLGFKDRLFESGYDRAYLIIINNINNSAWEKARTVLRNLLSVILGDTELKETLYVVRASNNSLGKSTDDMSFKEVVKCVIRGVAGVSNAEAVVYSTPIRDTYIPISSATTTYLEGGSVRVALYVPAPLRRLISIALARAATLVNEGEIPSLHTCISPVQVYVIPVGSRHLSYAIKVAEELRRHGMRVVVDSGSAGLGRRIRRAGRLWVPYIVVIGDREVGTDTVNVRIRRRKLQISMNINELVNTVLKDVSACIDLGVPATDERCRPE